MQRRGVLGWVAWVGLVVMLAALAWLTMVMLVVGGALLVSRAGGDVVKHLIAWPAFGGGAAGVVSAFAHGLSRWKSGGGDA